MKHFTISEMLKSETAIQRKLWNGATVGQEANLVSLIDNVLDPLREAFGRPIIVNSGFRCVQLNNLVAGASNSQHVKGQAADITAGSREGNRELMRLAVSLGLPFDQLVDEKNFSWVHISHNGDKSEQRGEILRYDGKSYRRIIADEI